MSVNRVVKMGTVMTSNDAQQPAALIGLTANIVAAYVQKHVVPAAELGHLIAGVHKALSKTVDITTTVEDMVVEPAKPAVPIRKSVTRDYIFCLEDGKKFKSLKRHLGSIYNMTPDEYRAKWKLPDDYPMVAPAYAEKRSQLARDIGLGRKADAAG